MRTNETSCREGKAKDPSRMKEGRNDRLWRCSKVRGAFFPRRRNRVRTWISHSNSLSFSNRVFEFLIIPDGGMKGAKYEKRICNFDIYIFWLIPLILYFIYFVYFSFSRIRAVELCRGRNYIRIDSAVKR